METNQRTSHKIIQEMKSLYASGQTAKELSEKFGISETKIKNWQHKQDWASARKEYDLKRSQTLCH